MLNMPGDVYDGAFPELSDDQLALKQRLESDVTVLASDIGPRNVFHPKNYLSAVEHIESRLKAAGISPIRETFRAKDQDCINVIAEISGASNPNEIIVIGAHYDSVLETVGADDNASAVAGLLELAARAATTSTSATRRFVFFANEEPPFFMEDQMGSRVYARGCVERSENIRAMLCLEMIGYFSDREKSQTYPIPLLDYFYPSRGNYIGFVGNLDSRGLTRRAVELFRNHKSFPAYGCVLPESVPGIVNSDHWSFWQEGYPAVMITDTAQFRNSNYHSHRDVPNTLNYEAMTRVVEGLDQVIQGLAND